MTYDKETPAFRGGKIMNYLVDSVGVTGWLAED